MFSLSGGQSAHSGSVTQLQHRIKCTPDQNSFPCIEAVFCRVSDALLERDPKKKINKAAHLRSSVYSLASWRSPYRVASEMTCSKCCSSSFAPLKDLRSTALSSRCFLFRISADKVGRQRLLLHGRGECQRLRNTVLVLQLLAGEEARTKAMES